MADDFGRVQRNVQSMIAQKAPESDIDGYLQSEGLTPDQFKTQATPRPKTKQEAYREYSDSLSPVSRFLNSIGDVINGPTDALQRGATLGLSDEVGAVGGAIGDQIGRVIMGTSDNGVSSLVTGQKNDFGSDYDRNLNDIRQRSADYDTAHPYVSTGLQLLGGLGTGGQALVGQAAPSLAKTVGQSALMGGVAGGASAEGGPENRALGAAGGAIIGGGAAAALPLAGAVAGKLGGAAMNLAGFTGNADTKAAQIISQYVGRDLSDGRDLGALGAALMKARQAGQPQSIMDAAGSNTTRLGRLAASAPGEASQAAENFVAGSRAELPYQAEASFANRVAPSTAAGASDEAIAIAGRKAARPLYEQAYEAPFLPTEDLMSYLDRPAFKDAARRAVRIAANDGVPVSQLGVSGFNEAGDPILSSVPNLRFMDYVKRGLDDVLSTYRDKATGKLVLDTEGNAINNARTEFVNMLDKQSPPEYQAARQVWGGMKESQDAIQAGRNFLKGQRDQVADNFTQLSPSDQNLFRQGMAAQLSEMVGKGQLGQLQRLMQSSPDFARKLGQFLTPDQFAGVSEDMGRLATIARRNNVVGGGSPTARIQAEQADASGMEGKLGAAFGLLNSYRTGGVSGAVGNLLTRGYGRAVGLSEPVAAKVGRELFTTDAGLQDALISRLKAQGLTSANRAALQRTMLSTLLGGGSTIGGRAIAPQSAS